MKEHTLVEMAAAAHAGGDVVEYIRDSALSVAESDVSEIAHKIGRGELSLGHDNPTAEEVMTLAGKPVVEMVEKLLKANPGKTVEDILAEAVRAWCMARGFEKKGQK